MTQSFVVQAGAQPYRVRELRPRAAGAPDTATRWLQCAERNALTPVEGVVRVHDWGLDRSTATLVTDLAGCASLKQIIQTGRALGEPLSWEASVLVALGVLDVLARADDAGLGAHADLDPTSILIRSDGSVLLTEFGLWQALDPRAAARLRFDHGRVHYVAPEVARATEAGTCSDLFSLGVVLFELLTGERPFKAKTELLVALAVAEGKRTQPLTLANDAPPGLADVIEVLLATHVHERFQHPRAAHNALGRQATPSDAAKGELATWVARLVAPVPSQHGTLELDVSVYLNRGTQREVPEIRGAAPSDGGPPPTPTPPPNLGVHVPAEGAFGVVPTAPVPTPWPSSEGQDSLAPPALLGAVGATPSVRGLSCGTSDEPELLPPPLFTLPGAPEGSSKIHPQGAPAVKDGHTSLLEPQTPELRSAPLQGVVPVASSADVPSDHASTPFDFSFDASQSTRPKDRTWREPSKTLFEMKKHATSPTKVARRRAPIAVVAGLSLLFAFVLAAGGTFLYRLLR